MNASNSEAIMEAHYHPAELVKLRSNDGPKKGCIGPSVIREASDELPAGKP
jgi:hypothetical protein